MRSEAQSGPTRLQLDNEGSVIGQRITGEDGKSFILLNDGFLWVFVNATGKKGIWSVNNAKLVELPKRKKRS